MLLFGWSLVEGLGAVLVIPAIAALIAANYEGKDRAFAYGMIGGVGRRGHRRRAADRRVGDDELQLAIRLRRRGRCGDRDPHRPRFNEACSEARARADSSTSAEPRSRPSLSGLIVFGILKSSAWGWIYADRRANDRRKRNHAIRVLGCAFPNRRRLRRPRLLLAWEERRERRGASALLDRGLLKIEHLRGGLSSLCGQQLILMGMFFVLPVYLQVVLGLDAFETGKRLFPMSISMLVAALIGPRMAARFAPRAVVQVGLGAMALAALVLLATIDVTLNGSGIRAVGLALFGIGAGLLVSQLGNVIMSSAPPEQTNEAGGLQGTAQNLGASLGTALIGAVLLLGLLNGFIDRIEQNPALSADVKTQIANATESGIAIVTTKQAHQALLNAGATAAEADAVTADYGNAQLDALRTSMLAVAFLAVISFWFTRRLPGRQPPTPLAAAEEV